MAEMPGMIRPDLQALPQVKDRMTFLYLELAQACGQMLDGTFPRIRGGDPNGLKERMMQTKLFPACTGVIPWGRCVSTRAKTFPRMRGGDPHTAIERNTSDIFSPHARG